MRKLSKSKRQRKLRNINTKINRKSKLENLGNKKKEGKRLIDGNLALIKRTKENLEKDKTNKNKGS
jgi:hypothetical protein